MVNDGFPIVPLNRESERFNDFLSLEGNERIIFTGIFGSGKTYFLRNFFDQHQNFLCFHLYPVNYSVSSNEDIFEYIKYDILFELLNHKVYLDKIDLSNLEALSFISSEDYNTIIKDFIAIIPEIGKTVIGLIEPIEKLKKIVDRIKIGSSTDQGKLIKDFATLIESKKGSLYENDFYTRLITGLIQQLKTTNENKKVVLVIDDLDRIDPEHIFRILNVLAVHFKNDKINEYENKFNIDKIILSCDIGNIRSIFNARFGQNVDFTGYIDKFYTKEIYSFDNSEYVKDIVAGVVTTVSSNNRGFLHNLNYEFLYYILNSMVKSNALSIRTLKRLYKSHIQIKGSAVRISGKPINLQFVQMYAVFEFISFIIGDLDSTHRAIQKTHFPDFNTMEQYAKELLVLVDFNKHKFIEKLTCDYNGLEYQIKRDGLYQIEIVNDEAGFKRLNFLSVGEFKKLMTGGFESFIQLKGRILKEYS